MADNEFVGWYKSIPKITRWWFTLCVVIPLAARFGLLPGEWLVLDFYSIVYRFQIWRLITCFFFFPITPMTGFAYLINLYFLYNYSTRLETGVFQGKPADYLFMLIFSGVILLIIGLLFKMYLLMTSLTMAALYLWCQVNRDTVVSFWFGTQFKAMYLPWILLAFNFILRGGVMADLAGIVAGHVYFFVMIKYPQDFGGSALLSTPQLFYQYLPNERGVAGFGHAPQARRDQPRNNNGRHQWGQGNTLE